MAKTYLLYCEYCGYKRITDGTDAKNMVEVKTSKLQITLPSIDPITHKTIPAKFKSQRKRFKCPKCGRLVLPRKIDEPNNPAGHQTGDEGPAI